MMRPSLLASLVVMIFSPNNALTTESLPGLRGSLIINSPTSSFELLDFIEESEESSNDKLIINSPISSNRFEEDRLAKEVVMQQDLEAELEQAIDEANQNDEHVFVVNESIEPPQEVDVSNQGSWSKSRWHRKRRMRKSASAEKGSWSLYTRAWYWVGIIFLVEVEV